MFSAARHSPSDEGSPAIFPGFAYVWAIATLIHQLSFTFWTEAWPGWLLVFSAIAVLFQPACLFRFTWLVVASLFNLIHKLPYVPNHILFEGMLHLTMLLVLSQYIAANNGISWVRDAFHRGWRFHLLLGVVLLKALYHLLPFIPNNPLLGTITTLMLLIAVCLFLFGRGPVHSGEKFLAMAAPVIRMALVLMYFWAAVQKMNFDYLNPDISCAAVLHQGIAKYFGGLIPVGRWALHGAIWGSFFFEIAIPILLFFPKTRTWGFLSAVWFHLWLAIHPAAGVYSFSSLILAVIYLFLPVGFWRELMTIFRTLAEKVGGGSYEKGVRRTVIFIITFFFVILSTQIFLYTTLARSFAVFHTANRLGFVAFATWGLFLGVCYVIAGFRAKNKENFFPNHPVKTIGWLGLILVFLNGLSPWVGGKTQTSFSMYSNLRTEGQGNHLFLKRMDLLPFQRDLVRVVSAEPNILDPSTRPKGIANFANPGHQVLAYFELRRLITTTPGDLKITYEHEGEIKKFSRSGETSAGDPNLSKPFPMLLRKLLWFRRLNELDGPMTCTH